MSILDCFRAFFGYLDGADDVGVAIDEADELFEAPEAAATAAQDELGQPVVLSELARLVVHVLEQHAHRPDQRHDQRAERHRSQMVPGPSEFGCLFADFSSGFTKLNRGPSPVQVQ